MDVDLLLEVTKEEKDSLDDWLVLDYSEMTQLPNPSLDILLL